MSASNGSVSQTLAQAEALLEHSADCWPALAEALGEQERLARRAVIKPHVRNLPLGEVELAWPEAKYPWPQTLGALAVAHNEDAACTLVELLVSGRHGEQRTRENEGLLRNALWMYGSAGQAYLDELLGRDTEVPDTPLREAFRHDEVAVRVVSNIDLARVKIIYADNSGFTRLVHEAVKANEDARTMLLVRRDHCGLKDSAEVSALAVALGAGSDELVEAAFEQPALWRYSNAVAAAIQQSEAVAHRVIDNPSLHRRMGGRISLLRREVPALVVAAVAHEGTGMRVARDPELCAFQWEVDDGGDEEGEPERRTLGSFLCEWSAQAYPRVYYYMVARDYHKHRSPAEYVRFLRDVAAVEDGQMLLDLLLEGELPVPRGMRKVEVAALLLRRAPAPARGPMIRRLRGVEWFPAGGSERPETGPETLGSVR